MNEQKMLDGLVRENGRPRGNRWIAGAGRGPRTERSNTCRRSGRSPPSANCSAPSAGGAAKRAPRGGEFSVANTAGI